MNRDTEETSRLVEEHDAAVDDEDEGFSELTADATLLDLKVSPIASSTVAPSPSSRPLLCTAAPGIYSMLPSSISEAGDTSDETMAVDDQNVPGYEHVDRLTEYLVGLLEQTSLCLTNVQADCTTELWQRLDVGDKQRVVYAGHHQQRLLTGRFRTPKKPSKTPGVESTTRCCSVPSTCSTSGCPACRDAGNPPATPKKQPI
ncbi:uncharacterized protein LOC105921442 [Fundulus heteroclitus]|uniref:uncharacterized protein LOC105921442 n=1 Tax=Fundulus heteroclitus TaxID=8078 RepID=UPI00165AEC35|nr:uncharacterized protein LOC105921442 [Fundulus heteroclitus]